MTRRPSSAVKQRRRLHQSVQDVRSGAPEATGPRRPFVALYWLPDKPDSLHLSVAPILLLLQELSIHLSFSGQLLH